MLRSNLSPHPGKNRASKFFCDKCSEEFGGIDNYFDYIGFAPSEVAKLRPSALTSLLPTCALN